MKFKSILTGFSILLISCTVSSSPTYNDPITPNIDLKNSMHQIKDAIEILRTTANKHEAWNALSKLTESTINTKLNPPSELLNNNEKLEKYASFCDEILNAVNEIKLLVEADRFNEIQDHLNRIDKIKADGHKQFKN